VKKSDVVKLILKNKYLGTPLKQTGVAFAPTNIALCKYWGKRDNDLNLPVTSSLSIALGKKGAKVNFQVINETHDLITLNGEVLDVASAFAQRLVTFLNLFRLKQGPYFSIIIESNIPIAAGLASSACGFASVVLALNQVFGWNLTVTELSILARLGSGSACRSLWQGFVEWNAGQRADGMDSYGQPLNFNWPDFCIGLLVMSEKEKHLSSREAMLRTVNHSALYSAWPAKVTTDLVKLKTALSEKDFTLLGETSESNAMSMHATMLSAWPPISYALPETVMIMQKIWKLRSEGLPLYFTQDAGPNLKLLFLEAHLLQVKAEFSHIEIVKPFAHI
jgi:diphosphomevalonate decarboxylase